MKRTLCVLMVIAWIALGCGDSERPRGDSDQPPITLTVGHVGHDHQIALGVAALEGERFRKEYGIYLKERKHREVYDLIDGGKPMARLLIRKVMGGSAMPAAMEGGQIDIGLGGVAPVAKFVDKGQPFKIICPLHADGDFLVMKADSPLTDWASFVAAAEAAARPIKIGYKKPVAVAKLIFVRALAAEGIPWKEGTSGPGVKVVMINCQGAKNILPSLQSGAIDGFVMNQPQPSIAKIKKLGRIIADLRDLPPRGRWSKHPCCCVAATEKVLRDHAAAVKSFLKTIHLATALMQKDIDLAVRSAARWTKTDRKVEADSVPGIPYLSLPTAEYMDGIKTWAVLMAEEGQFTGALKGLSPEQVVGRICQMRLCEQAAEELRDEGFLR
jgi:NitT/TauT family transport system substrate-binding protein